MSLIYRKHKWITVLLLAVILILTVSPVVLADQTSPLLNNSDIQGYNQQHAPNYGEKFIAGIVTSVIQWVMNLFYIDDPTILVFGYDARTDKNSTFLANGLYGSLLSQPDQASQVVLGIFPAYFFKAIAVFYDGFTKLLPIPLVLIMVVLGLMFMMNTGTTEGRSKIKDYTQAFLTGLVTLRFGAYIWTAIISVIHFLIQLIWAYMLQNKVTPSFFMNMIWGDGQAGFNAATQVGSLPMAILLFMAMMMVLALNYQYVMRLITMGLLILIFPIVTTLSTFPPYRHALQTWMKEFVASAILPLAHALALGVFFMLEVMPGFGKGGAFWLMLAYFSGLPAITNLIRELLGLQGGFGGGVKGAIAGAAGVAALGSMGQMFSHHSGNADNAAGDTPNVRPKLSGATSIGGKAGQGIYNAGRAIAGHKATQALAGGMVKTAAMGAGGAYAAMTGGNAAQGMMMGHRMGGKISSLGTQTANHLGGGIHTVAQSISENQGIKSGLSDVPNRLVDQSMQGGGHLAKAAWGAQGVLNKVSGERFAGPSFVKENRSMMRTAQSSMQDLRPQMDLAKAKYEHSLSHQGPDHQETKDLRDQYEGLKGIYDTHASDLHLAQTRLKNPDAWHQHREALSNSRGSIK